MDSIFTFGFLRTGSGSSHFQPPSHRCWISRPWTPWVTFEPLPDFALFLESLPSLPSPLPPLPPFFLTSVVHSMGPCSRTRSTSACGIHTHAHMAAGDSTGKMKMALYSQVLVPAQSKQPQNHYPTAPRAIQASAVSSSGATCKAVRDRGLKHPHENYSRCNCIYVGP